MQIEQEHPVPQQISSYQFRLVGDMTLKQFAFVAAGALISLFFYAIGLPPVVKWPLVILSFLSGLGFAFVSLQDRPMQVWIIAFFRSVYSPTEFYWKKTTESQQFFSPSVSPTSVGTNKVEVEKEPNKSVQTDHLNDFEQKFLTNLSTINSSKTVPNTPTQQVQTPIPEPKKDVSIPTNIPINVGPTTTVPPVQQAPATPLVSQGVPINDMLTPRKISVNPAQFSPDAAPPSRPTTPNIVVGQVMDSEGSVVEGAILEIRDSNSRPVRALKSNRAGHFLVATPLTNGKYEISVDKEGLEFSPVMFETNGTTIEPIAIRSKNNIKHE